MQALILSEMIWPEVEAVKDKIEIAIVPVGSTEQHGPNMTFETDTARAYEFAKLVGQHMGERALICPPITYGLSAHHMMFPGTITLRGETFINLCTDIATSLAKQGFKKIGFLNGHGGNNTALDVVVTILKHDHDIDAFYCPTGGNMFADAIEPEWEWSIVKGHACESEGSQALAICPWVVRDERYPGDLVEDSIAMFGSGNLFQWGGKYAWDWQRDFTKNGALGDARKINAEHGEKCNALALERVLAIIEGFIKLQ